MSAEPNLEKADAKIKRVNRRAAIVKAKQPYFEWAQSVLEDLPKFTLEDLRQNCTVWLLPMDENPEEFLRREYYAIFQHELGELCSHLNRWPDSRTFENSGTGSRSMLSIQSMTE